MLAFGVSCLTAKGFVSARSFATMEKEAPGRSSPGIASECDHRVILFASFASGQMTSLHSGYAERRRMLMAVCWISPPLAATARHAKSLLRFSYSNLCPTRTHHNEGLSSGPLDNFRA